MNELKVMNISGVDCYEKDGVAYLKLETVARGLGFTRIANSGNEVVRWETVRKYLFDLGMPARWHGGEKQVGSDGLPDFIPENIFYRLAMKAKNETAEKFQALVADDIIPTIRKHGAYMTPKTIDDLLANPDLIIELATQLKKERSERKRLEEENEIQRQTIEDYQPKVTYYDTILQSKEAITVSQIAADYGMSAKALNKILYEEGIQNRVGGQWILYRKHMGKGYTKSITHRFEHYDGTPGSKVLTKWTQKGRVEIHRILESRGIKAIMDLEDE